MVLAVSFYDVVVWFHISAVVAGLGPTFAYGAYLAFAGRNHPRSIPAMLAAQTMLNRTLVTIGAILILLSGIYLTAEQWNFGDFFVSWGIVAILVLLGLVHAVFIPNDRRAQALAERDIDAAGAGEVRFGDEFRATARRSGVLGPIAGLIVILTIYVMVAKPFL